MRALHRIATGTVFYSHEHESFLSNKPGSISRQIMASLVDRGLVDVESRNRQWAAILTDDGKRVLQAENQSK